MTPAEPRHEFVEANGVRFHYVEQGDGPLVMLLHGFPECWYSWRLQLPHSPRPATTPSPPTCAATTSATSPAAATTSSTLVDDVDAIGRRARRGPRPRRRPRLGRHRRLAGGVAPPGVRPEPRRDERARTRPHSRATSVRSVRPDAQEQLHVLLPDPAACRSGSSAAEQGRRHRRRIPAQRRPPRRLHGRRPGGVSRGLSAPRRRPLHTGLLPPGHPPGPGVLPTGPIVVPTLVLWGEGDPVLSAP